MAQIITIMDANSVNMRSVPCSNVEKSTADINWIQQISWWFGTHILRRSVNLSTRSLMIMYSVWISRCVFSLSFFCPCHSKSFRIITSTLSFATSRFNNASRIPILWSTPHHVHLLLGSPPIPWVHFNGTFFGNSWIFQCATPAIQLLHSILVQPFEMHQPFSKYCTARCMWAHYLLLGNFLTLTYHFSFLSQVGEQPWNAPTQSFLVNAGFVSYWFQDKGPNFGTDQVRFRGWSRSFTQTSRISHVDKGGSFPLTLNKSNEYLHVATTNKSRG